MPPLYPVALAENEAANTITVTGNCTVTKKEYSVTVPLDGWREFKKGAHAQHAFPR